MMLWKTLKYWLKLIWIFHFLQARLRPLISTKKGLPCTSNAFTSHQIAKHNYFNIFDTECTIIAITLIESHHSYLPKY